MQTNTVTRTRLITTLALGGAALAITFLTVGVGHSLIILTTGGVGENDLTISRGRWEWVLGSIAVFLAFLLLIPIRRRHEWRTHGIYAAFIVSLFAEMFGFPLTAYFLASVFGMTFFEKEFMRYMYSIGMPLGSLITFVGILLIILGWREVYRAKDTLATRGIYKYLRHPQYLGILLVTGGWLVHWPTLPGLVMFPILVVLYYRLSRREDAYLASMFGEAYSTYAQKTPMLFPIRLSAR